MSHQNTIPAQGAGTTGATSVDAHTHPVTDSGVKVDSTASASVFVALHTSIATSTTTGTSHTHATAAHDHGGLTGFADHTPLHLKVLFCRRRLGT